MGIRLDWQIEAESVYQRAGEDPNERRQRRKRRYRIVFFSAFIIGWLCISALLIALRLNSVDTKLRNDLTDTVNAEIVALRIGDYAGFMNLQRSASNPWIASQNDKFTRYQELKTTVDLKMPGTILDATVDGARGRVVVEEKLGNVPYRAVWFYWRYQDGWRHVPPDYTFWGDEQTYKGKIVTVHYHQLDASLATSLGQRIEQWWAAGCGVINCRVQPQFTVEVVANGTARLQWSSADVLSVPSPLATEERTQSDIAIPVRLEDGVAVQVAERLFDAGTGQMRPVPTADADWLRQATIDWLAGSFTGRADPEQVGFIYSLFQHYGSTAVAALVQTLLPDSDISVVGTALQQPLGALNLDWRTFFQWRLDVEKTFLARGDQAGFQALWDAANPAVLKLMQERIGNPSQATPQVQSVSIETGEDGNPRALVQTLLDSNPYLIVFRLVDGSWKRSA